VIVQCPYCNTRYELDVARVAGANPMLKCSKCRHIFPAPSATPRSPAPAAASRRVKPIRPDEQSLTLPFAPRGEKAPPGAAPGDDLSIPETEDRFTLGPDEPPADELTIPENEPDVTPAAAAAADETDDEQQVIFGDEDDDDAFTIRDDVVETRRSRTRHPGERSHVVPLLIFLAVVVAAYGALTATLFGNPTLTDQWIGRLPIIGTLGDERLLVRKIALSEVSGTYQRIKDGKEVFVISGSARNTAPVPLHGVQVAAKLYDNAGVPIDQKVIACGNVISARVLKDLTAQEVTILQRLTPPKRFAIEPGESSTFVIVFMDPPRQAVEFTTQVVAAQRQA
jgi:predicted Zn finger-like uncharacterized protein